MRTGKGQRGQFDIREGMAFIMDDMQFMIPKGEEIDAGIHPWLVTMVDDDFVEIVMCTTLINDSTGKHKDSRLDFDDVVDLINGCPPLDPPHVMLNGISLSTVTTLPKKELFSHRLRVLNQNTKERNFITEGQDSLCMSEKDLTIVISALNDYLKDHKEINSDPFGIEEAEDNLYKLYDGEPIPEGFTEQSYKDNFDWQNIPKADPKAIYPAEHKMHSYEKNDPKLLHIVRKRDMRHDGYKKQAVQEINDTIILTQEDIAKIPMTDNELKR